MNSKSLKVLDQMIAIAAIFFSGFGWGFIYLIVPVFGAIVLTLLLMKLAYKSYFWTKSPSDERKPFAELFRLMRNNSVISVRLEWALLALAFSVTLALMKDVLVIS